MKKTQRNVALLLTSLLFLVCAIMGVVGITRQQKVTIADATSYVSPLPAGASVADYTVLDVNVGALSGSAIKTQQAMGDANAVRFKVTATAANTWNTYIGLFCSDAYYKAPAGEAHCYFSFRQVQDSNLTRTIGLNITVGGTAVNDVPGGKVTALIPSWLNLSVAGATYNFEAGALPVQTAEGTRAGTLIYLDIDNARVLEYFYANDQFLFSGNNFHYEANQTAGSVTSYEQSVIDASSASVTFAKSAYGPNEEPKPLVTLVTEKDGSSYGRTLTPFDYDIEYVNNDKSGDATVNLTFKGRYTGSKSATFKVADVIGDAVASYANPLPEGAYVEDYTVLDVAKEYGTNGTLTYTTSGDKGKSFELKGARAIKLKLTQDKTPWSLRFSIFNTTEGYLYPNNSSAHVDLRSGLLDVLPNETVHNVYWAFPTGTTYNAGNNAYEFGGPKVFNANGEYIGRLFYFEINGLRVCEYFFEHDGTSILNDDYFFIHDVLSASAGTSTITITSPEVADITNDVTVKFGANKITDGKATPEVKVLYAKEFGGKVYVKEVESTCYDVTYTANGANGTATANVQFKGKYTGSASKNFEVAEIKLISDTDDEQLVYAMSGASVVLGKVEVDGRTFIGYDIGRTLVSSIEVVAQNNTTVKFVTVDFETLNKVSIRIFGTMGMRFISSIDSSDVERLSSYGTVSFGTKITSPDKAGYMNIPTQNWVQSGELFTEGRDTFTAVVTGITSNDYTTRFTAVAYVEIAVEGGETVVAYANVESEYTRTYAELCYMAIEAGDIDSDNPQYEYFSEVASYYVAE